MFRNQYLISSNRINNLPDSFTEHPFESLYIYTEANLEYNSASHHGNQVAIIGFAVDPFNPRLDNQQLATRLALTGNSLESLADGVGDLSGRFVLLAKGANYFVVIPDACALRRVYFASKHSFPLLVTSSPVKN